MNIYEEWDAQRKELIEADIIIAQDGENWAVISLSGYHLHATRPEVLQSALTTIEAAEACRECHIFNAMDDALHSHPYHPGSAVPLEHFNTRGCSVAELKSFHVQGDIPRIANCTAIALEAGQPNSKLVQIDTDLPF